MPSPSAPYHLPDDTPEDPAALQQDNRSEWLNTTDMLQSTHRGNPALRTEPFLTHPDAHDLIP